MPTRRRAAIRPEPGVAGSCSASRAKQDQAEQWYRKAADAGDADAMVNLGALLAERGEEDQAGQWYRKAADARRRDG